MSKTEAVTWDFLSAVKKKLGGSGTGSIIARAATGSFAINVLGTGIAFGVNILLARLLGVTEYGIYIYALTWINILALICQLGMNTSLLRFIPAYNSRGEWQMLQGILRQSTKYVFIISAIIASIASVFIWLFFDRLGNNQAITFLVALLILPLLSLAALRSAALRAFKQVIKAGIPESIVRPLVIASLTLLLYYILQWPVTSVHVMAFNLLGALAAFFVGTIWLREALPDQLRNTTATYNTGEWFRVSLPLFFIAGMNMLLHQTDVVMLGAILNTDQAGIYAVASRIAGLAFFGLAAVNSIVAPMISEYYSTGRHDELQRLITLAAKGIWLVTIFLSGSLIFFGDFILNIFGTEFSEAYVALVILIIGQTINAVAGSVGFLMTMTGHHNQAAKILGLSAVINILLNSVLISEFGIIGAAIATAITTALWNFSMLYYVVKKLNINPTAFERKKG